MLLTLIRWLKSCADGDRGRVVKASGIQARRMKKKEKEEKKSRRSFILTVVAEAMTIQGQQYDQERDKVQLRRRKLG